MRGNGHAEHVAPAVAAMVLAGVCLALALASAVVPETLLASLEYNRTAILAGEVWRLWTGHLVHYSLQHAVVDSIVLLAASLFAIKILGKGWLWYGFVWIAPLISLGLMWWTPALQHYRGLSGIAAALTLCVAAELYRTDASSRPWLVFFCIVMTFKIIGDANGITLYPSALPTGVKVEWHAHVLGAAAAVVILAWRLARGFRMQRLRLRL